MAKGGSCHCRDDWDAWLNTMPPGPDRLYVKGRAVCPTPGYTLELIVGPQIPESTTLTLELHERRPTGIVTQVLTETPFAYAQVARVGLYTSVAIRGCGTKPIRIVT